jgi:hypothetical protein
MGVLVPRNAECAEYGRLRVISVEVLKLGAIYKVKYLLVPLG